MIETENGSDVHLLYKQNEKLTHIILFFSHLNFKHKRGVTDGSRGKRLEVFINGSCCVSFINIG